MKKLKHKEDKQLVQSHTTMKGRSRICILVICAQRQALHHWHAVSQTGPMNCPIIQPANGKRGLTFPKAYDLLVIS